jgi:hypothetical protein
LKTKTREKRAKKDQNIKYKLRQITRFVVALK